MYVFEYGWPVAEVSVVHAADGTGAAVPAGAGVLVTGNDTVDRVGVATGAGGEPVHAARLTRMIRRIAITTAYFTDIVPR